MECIRCQSSEIDEVVSRMLGLEWNLDTEGMLASWRSLMCQQKIVHCGHKIVLERPEDGRGDWVGDGRLRCGQAGG